MTPKEKALQLYWKYYNRIEHTLSEEYSQHETFICIDCALIAVDEILDIIDTIYDYDREYLNPYWIEVKKEIKKL